MFLEVVVATICLAGQDGCSSATNAYYQSNKELQETFKNVEKFGQEIIKGHEYIVYIMTPVYAVVLGKPAIFKLSSHINFNVNVKGNTLALQWTY